MFLQRVRSHFLAIQSRERTLPIVNRKHEFDEATWTSTIAAGMVESKDHCKSYAA